jgi:hypothetical protein
MISIYGTAELSARPLRQLECGVGLSYFSIEVIQAGKDLILIRNYNQQPATNI